ncbi:LLM class flavin-dependent oxidoreductase [Baekduia soli]|nr:LLM class flavin-dependent oxidoreductase [Baekduia soli]
MHIGYGMLTCQRYPGDPRTDHDLYRQALELAQDTDRLGFDSVWVAEHHFLDDSHMSSLLPVCAAIAARTERVLVGTGVVLAPLIDPFRLAEDAATVDLIASGRLLLGLGLGWREEEFEVLGVPIAERVARLRRCVEILRGAWSDGLVEGVSVTPKPFRPGGPPIWIGAGAEPAVRRAGRIADGFFGANVTPAEFGERVKWARDAREQAGLDPESMTAALHLPTFAWPDEDRWEIIRDSVWYLHWKYEDMLARGRRPPAPPAPPMPATLEDGLRDSVVLGAPEQVAERLLAYRDAAGPNFHFVGRFWMPGVEHAVMRESAAIFAEQVIPHLLDGAPKVPQTPRRSA